MIRAMALAGRLAIGAALCGFAGAGLAAPPPRPPHADPSTGVAGREKVGVHLRVLGTNADDEGIQGSTTVTGSGDNELAIGESRSVYVSVMGPDIERNFLCMASTGAEQRRREELTRKLLDPGAHLWWADIRALPARMGQISLEVKWDHYFSERGGRPVRIAGDTRRIVMDEGERTVIDFLASDDLHPSRCYRNVTIDVTAETQEDPSLAGETIGYDLWFKHTDKQGVVTARRFQGSGRQGERLDFRFAPIRIPVPGVVLEDGSRLDSIIDTGGAIRGRLRPDGTIEVDVGATRWIGGAPAGRPRTGGSGGGGRKQFSMSPGETVSMILPPPTGSYSFDGATEHKVDNKEFYGGHKDELVLTVRREP